MQTIAIIDDDIHIGDMLTEVLTREGYSMCCILPFVLGVKGKNMLYNI